VDVEQLRPIDEALQIAEKFFSAPERAELAMVPHAQMPKAFLNCWTRKEAYVKALGDGLSVPLDSFQVSLLPGRPAEFIDMSGASKNEKEWVLRDLQPSPGYVAALAFRSISTSSAYRLGQSVAVVVSGPIPGAALAATTTNPAPEAY